MNLFGFDFVVWCADVFIVGSRALLAFGWFFFGE
jgi:hypothetical protein